MSKALKCNRCECCFDPESNPDAEIVNFWNPIYTKGEHYFKDINFAAEPILFGSESPTRIDLCPACARDFSAFMKCETKPAINVSRENEIKKYLEEIELLKDEIDRLTDELFSEQNARADCEATIDLQDDELSRALKARTDAEMTVELLKGNINDLNDELFDAREARTDAEETVRRLDDELSRVRENAKDTIDKLHNELNETRKELDKARNITKNMAQEMDNGKREDLK